MCIGSVSASDDSNMDVTFEDINDDLEEFDDLDDYDDLEEFDDLDELEEDDDSDLDDDDWDDDFDDWDITDYFAKDYIIFIENYLNNQTDYDWEMEFDEFEDNENYMSRYANVYNFINSTYSDYEDYWDLEFFEIITPYYLSTFHPEFTLNETLKDLHSKFYFEYAEFEEYDYIDFCVKNYIVFFETYLNNQSFNNTQELLHNFTNNTDFMIKYNILYKFVNLTYSDYEDYLDYDFFKIMYKFYLKTFYNSTDEDVNQTEEFFEALYNEFMNYIYTHVIVYKMGAFSSFGSACADASEEGILGDASYSEPSAHEKVANGNPFNPFFNNSYSNITSNSTANNSSASNANVNINDDGFNIIMIIVLIIILFAALIL